MQEEKVSPKVKSTIKPTAGGKLMSKNVKAAPKKAKPGGLKSKGEL
jgi:hypothetical protein